MVVLRSVLLVGIVASIAALVVAGAPSSPASPASPASRTFAFTYEARISAPAGAKRLDVWVPLPIEDDLQTVADLKVEGTVAGKPVEVRRTRDEPYGNRIAYVGIEGPAGEVVLRWTATIVRKQDEGQANGGVLHRWLEADTLVPITGRAADLAKTLKADDPDAPVRTRAQRIYDDVLDTMEYDKTVPGWGKGDFERACDVGKGNCTDFHAKFMAIGRAASIPVRFTMGIPLGADPEGKTTGYHCWAHFRDGERWVPVDISEAQKVRAKDPDKARWFFGHLDADRIALTVGRDLTLSPQQKGAALPFFVHPHAEADGQPLDLPAESRSFAWKDE